MEAEHSVVVNRPPNEVFAFVADGENAPRWRPGVLDVKHESGDGVGAVYRQGVKGPMGRRIAADYEITAFEPGHRLAFQAIAGPFRPRGEFRFEPAGNGTKVTFTLRGELTGLRKMLMGSAASKTMRFEVRSLDKLRELLEA